MTIPVLTAIADRYKRHRHTIGFGVHSPLAYWLVRNVLRDWKQYSYYTFHDIDVMTRGDADSVRTRRRARVLHRLVARMTPSRINWIGEVPEVFRMAAKTCFPGDPDGSLTVAVAPDDDALRRINDALGRHCAGHYEMYLVLEASPEMIDTLTDAISDGVVLAGRRSLLAVLTEKVGKVVYPVVL